MKRTILLLATVALALLLVGGVAVSQQQLQERDTSSQPTTTTDKQSGGDISIQSFTEKASFTSGSNATFLRVAVSDHGNLLAFESPQGQQSVAVEGYTLCSSASTGGTTANGYDVGGAESGFGTPTFVQPNGAGTFPLTVTRNTTDGKFQLKQVWAKPDAAEKDVTVTMTVKNLSSASISGVYITRLGDIDAGGNDSIVGSGFTDRGARTRDSALQWDDYSDPSAPYNGVLLTALTSQISNTPVIEALAGGNLTGCFSSTELTTPTERQDLAMRNHYFLGNLAAGASKTVKYQYSRM